MRLVTVGAVLGHIGMFKNKGSLIFHMATGAHRLGRRPLDERLLNCSVRFVAVNTGHLVLGDGMVRELGELHANLLMASITELGHLLPAHFLLGSLMQAMAVETTDIAVGMSAGMPVLKNGCGSCGMALETDERLSLGWKVFQRQ